MTDAWDLTEDLTTPETEREALTVLTQQLSELVAPAGLGKSIIDYYESTHTNLTREMDRIKSDTLQALHAELKSDPKISEHTWMSTVNRLTQECYDTANTQTDDLHKLFLASLQAKLVDKGAPKPHLTCNKLIAARSATIHSIISM